MAHHAAGREVHHVVGANCGAKRTTLFLESFNVTLGALEKEVLHACKVHSLLWITLAQKLQHITQQDDSDEAGARIRGPDTRHQLQLKLANRDV